MILLVLLDRIGMKWYMFIKGSFICCRIIKTGKRRVSTLCELIRSILRGKLAGLANNAKLIAISANTMIMILIIFFDKLSLSDIANQSII